MRFFDRTREVLRSRSVIMNVIEPISNNKLNTCERAPHSNYLDSQVKGILNLFKFLKINNKFNKSEKHKQCVDRSICHLLESSNKEIRERSL